MTGRKVKNIEQGIGNIEQGTRNSEQVTYTPKGEESLTSSFNTPCSLFDILHLVPCSIFKKKALPGSGRPLTIACHIKNLLLGRNCIFLYNYGIMMSCINWNYNRSIRGNRCAVGSR
jgi:hypothetical protein